MSEAIDDIVIVRKGRDIFGNPVVLYFYKNQPDLKRIKLKNDSNRR